MNFFNSRKNENLNPHPNPAMGKEMDQKGFTLIEIMLVTIIIGILVLTVAPYLNQYIDVVRVTRCISEIDGMERQIDAYVIENNEYPASLDLLPSTPDGDAWGRPYVYLVYAADPASARIDDGGFDMNPNSYDLYSHGADGLTAQKIDDPGAEDDVLRGSDGGFIGRASNF